MNNNETHKLNNNNHNNNRRRSSRYSNNKNYRNNYRTQNNKNENKKHVNKPSDESEFSVTKQQVFDFDEMKFSDELDTSFVDGRKRKKKNIEEELNRSYEKTKENEKNREVRKKPKLRKGRLVVFILFFVLLLALLVTCIFILLKPVKTKVVTKEKEVVVMDDNYLFLGDSITEQYDLDEYFKDLPVVNSGISGNQTSNILEDLKDRVYQYNPSKVFLLIGTNDIQAKVDEDEIIDNIEEILKEIHENRPYAELYLEAIYPVDESRSGAQDRTNEEIKSINDTLEQYCKKNDITFIDTYELLLDPESDEDEIFEDYTKDGLHITDEGYEVITNELEKYMK